MKLVIGLDELVDLNLQILVSTLEIEDLSLVLRLLQLAPKHVDFLHELPLLLTLLLDLSFVPILPFHHFSISRVHLRKLLDQFLNYAVVLLHSQVRLQICDIIRCERAVDMFQFGRG